MDGYLIVHKILYGEGPNRTIALAKFADPANIKEIRCFIGIIETGIESVTLKQTEALFENGLEVSRGALDIFLTKEDYDEHDLLTNDEKGLAVRLKE